MSPEPAPEPSSERCARDGAASGSATADPRMRNTSDRFMLFTRVGARGLLIGDTYAEQLDAQDWRIVPLEDPDGAALHQHRPGGDAAHWHGRPPRELDGRRRSFPSRFRRSAHKKTRSRGRAPRPGLRLRDCPAGGGTHYRYQRELTRG